MPGLFARLFSRHKNNLPPFDFARNRHPARSTWPPALAQLTHKQQFRYERKFKRRVKLRATNPTWNRGVGIAMWSLISFIVVYGVLIHDYEGESAVYSGQSEKAFDGIRSMFWGVVEGFYTHTEESIRLERGARRVVPLGEEERLHGGDAKREGGNR